MNILSKTAITTLATLTVSLGAAFIASAPSQAAGLSNPTQLSQTLTQGEADVIKVGRRHRHRGFRHHRGPRFGFYVGHGGYYNSYARDCFWKTKRRWSNYRGRYVYRKVRVCY